MKTAAVNFASIRRLAVSTQAYAPRFRRARPGGRLHSLTLSSRKEVRHA